MVKVFIVHTADEITLVTTDESAAKKANLDLMETYRNMGILNPVVRLTIREIELNTSFNN